MRVGLDFRALQLGHQFRGIGQVIRATCREIDRRLPATDSLTVFVDPNGPSVEPELAAIGVTGREARTVELAYPRFGRVARLRGGLTDAEAATIAAHADVMVQFDFMLGVPADTPSALVVYDQIPLLLGDRYPSTYRPTYRAARGAGLPAPTAAKKALGRVSYERCLAASLDRADIVVAISDHTAATTVAFAAEHRVAGVADRVVVTPLGADPPGPPAPLTAMEQARVDALGLADRPFFLFMGGGDERRRIDHLVAAFNHQRGRGLDAQLVLAGYDFVSPETVQTTSAREALLASGYAEDIHLLGFVSAAERAWLYDRAAAFVFPTEHEGFGLPVIESLAAGCAVIAYETSAIAEVAGPNCLICPPRWPDLADAMAAVLARDPDEAAAAAGAGREWASSFTWDAIGSAVVSWLESSRPGGRAQL